MGLGYLVGAYSLGATPPMEFEHNSQYGLILFCYFHTHFYVIFILEMSPSIQWYTK